MKRLAIILALALASSAALANMLLLGAGGGGSGGGGGGPTTVYQCNGSTTNFNISFGSADGDGYSTGTVSGQWADVRLPSSGKPTLSNGTTYTFTFDVKDSTATPASTIAYARIRLTDGTNRFGVTLNMSDGSVAGNTTSGGGSVSSSNVSDLGAGKKRLAVTGSSSSWGATTEFQTFVCSDADCNDSPASGSYVFNLSSCKITTP